jgi:hypothetical protein
MADIIQKKCPSKNIKKLKEVEPNHIILQLLKMKKSGKLTFYKNSCVELCICSKYNILLVFQQRYCYIFTNHEIISKIYCIEK